MSWLKSIENALADSQIEVENRINGAAAFAPASRYSTVADNVRFMQVYLPIIAY